MIWTKTTLPEPPDRDRAFQAILDAFTAAFIEAGAPLTMALFSTERIEGFVTIYAVMPEGAAFSPPGVWENALGPPPEGLRHLAGNQEVDDTILGFHSKKP